MEYPYGIAVSFAGEDRITAEEIASKLKANNVNVFYDKYEEAHLLGMDLYEHLHEIYSKKAQFCIMLISRHYVEKVWTNHERKSAQERALKEDKPYIIPVRIDTTAVPGLAETVAYFDLRNRSINELITLVLQKLNSDSNGQSIIQKANPVEAFTIALPKKKNTFSERDKDRFYEDGFSLLKKYFQQGIGELNKLQNIEADFTEMASHRFTCKIYRNGTRVSACTIWFGSTFSRDGGINYVNQANQDSSSSTNEILTIAVTEEALVFKALMNMFASAKTEYLSPIEAAEYLWGKLIEDLNR